MCSIAIALAGLTTGLQMAGQYQQSRAQAASLEAQSQAAKAQAEAAYQNAKIQNKQSEQMAEKYAYEQRKLDNQRKLVLGQQTAAAGASGIASGVGSSLDIYNATMDAWQQDTGILLGNQRNDTYTNYVGEVNYRNQGNAYTAEASNYKSQAKAAKQAGNIAMFGTLLGAASQFAGMKTGGGTSSKTWVGNVPRSVHEATGAGVGVYRNPYGG